MKSLNEKRYKFLLQPSLPNLNVEDSVKLFDLINNKLEGVCNEIHEAMISCLENNVSTGDLISYKDFTNKYSYRQPSCFVKNIDDGSMIHNINDLCLINFKDQGFIHCIFLNFEVKVSKPYVLPNIDNIRKYTLSPSFISVPKPWDTYLENWSKKEQKKIVKIKFGVSFRINLPIENKLTIPKTDECKHIFNIFPLGVWQWRLLWKCRICGLICHCNCFENAIKKKSFTPMEINRYQDLVPINLMEVPFVKNACDLCRGVPSTDEFCHEMYARSLFEQRYGAYIEKRLIEMDADYGDYNYEQLKLEVNNQLRNELGFKSVGERFVTETELFRILKMVFPNEEVIHHYRDKWLEGLELDIYIPSKHLGVEYHGIQHFEEISAWGGADALSKTQERDAKKVLLCKKNKTKLIVFTYEDEININLVYNRLKIEGTI